MHFWLFNCLITFLYNLGDLFLLWNNGGFLFHLECSNTCHSFVKKPFPRGWVQLSSWEVITQCWNKHCWGYYSTIFFHFYGWPQNAAASLTVKKDYLKAKATWVQSVKMITAWVSLISGISVSSHGWSKCGLQITKVTTNIARNTWSSTRSAVQALPSESPRRDCGSSAQRARWRWELQPWE